MQRRHRLLLALLRRHDTHLLVNGGRALHRDQRRLQRRGRVLLEPLRAERVRLRRLSNGWERPVRPTTPSNMTSAVGPTKIGIRSVSVSGNTLMGRRRDLPAAALPESRRSLSRASWC